MAERYPLSWPDGWKRAAHRTSATFGKAESRFDSASGSFRRAGKRRLSISDAINRIADELGRINVKEETVIISTNLRTNLQGVPRGDLGEPSDPGVAVYWERKGKKQCMAIDRYTRVADNLAAIAATLDALRAIERHGGGEILDRAFQGFAQLPAAIVTAEPWRSVFEFASNARITIDEVEGRFRHLAKRDHADTGGNDDLMRRLLQARSEAKRELSPT